MGAGTEQPAEDVTLVAGFLRGPHGGGVDEERVAPAHLRALFDRAPAIVTLYEGPDHVCTYANPQALRLLTGRGLLHRPLREAVPEWATPALLEQCGRVLRTGQPSIVPEQHLGPGLGDRHDAGTRYLDYHLTPWLAAGGTVRGVLATALEVTERVRARARARETEDRFHALADTTPVMIWMSGTDGLRDYVNRPWLEFTGRSLEQELGAAWAEGVHPDDRDRCLETYRTAFAAREPFSTEYRLRRADGTYGWVLDNGAPRTTGAEAFLGYIGSCIDITEHKRHEQALRESEQRYRILLERANDAIFVFPIEADGTPGRYLEVNEVACQRLGYTREELLALTPQAIVDTGPEPYGNALERALSALRAVGSIVVERTHVAKDGRRLPVEVSATLLDLRGRPTVILIARDIAERRRAEQAVRDSEERLRFTLEAAAVGSWDWDMLAGRVHWSDNLEAIHGLPPGAFGGDFQSFLADVHPDDRDRVIETIRGAAERGDGSYHVEYRLPRPDGTERWVEGKGRTIRDAAGRPVRMAGICMDISERKCSERMLQLLLRELQHRVKNTLAVVQSIGSQTMRSAGSLEAFTAAFQGRLAGLAQTHDLLAEANWAGADLAGLVAAELSPRVPPHRLQLAGAPVTLPPKAALTIGMVLHELVTNAAKHGALSNETGTLDVRWRTVAEADGVRLALEWIERHGPAVQTPERRGFGMRLIEQSVVYELDGEAALEFAPAGLRCRVSFPLGEARPAARPGAAPAG